MKENGKKKISAGKIAGRILLVAATVLLALLITVFSVCAVLAHGPSTAVRNMLVLSAEQASATKWVPPLFLGKKKVNEIIEAGKQINEEVIEASGISIENGDEWTDNPDGTRIVFIKKPKFKAYLMIVKDPSRVHVGVSSENFQTATEGMRIFDIVKKYDAAAAINGGEFLDVGGFGLGGAPMGLTYSFGEKVWDDGLKRTFIGFDKNNKLICSEGMDAQTAEKKGIRDAVSFQSGNVLIEQDGDNVKLLYRDSNTGTAQRTAIGQRSDGAVLLLVTDGRSSESIGATKNDVIDIMAEYSAVCAGMLDGGSSAMMYSRDYAEKYGIDKASLDSCQRQGLVNRYKALTKPRQIPTYFVVTGE